jgi:pilus assembly protein Flp/PilA
MTQLLSVLLPPPCSQGEITVRKLINATKNLFARKEEGAALAEYALLLILITVALIAVITLFSGAISDVFQTTISVLTPP